MHIFAPAICDDDLKAAGVRAGNAGWDCLDGLFSQRRDVADHADLRARAAVDVAYSGAGGARRCSRVGANVKDMDEPG